MLKDHSKSLMATFLWSYDYVVVFIESTQHFSLPYRIDLVPENPNHFQFVYDDIKDRGYVFMSNVETNLAHMLWVANGEQYNTYEATQRFLTVVFRITYECFLRCNLAMWPWNNKSNFFF